MKSSDKVTTSDTQSITDRTERATPRDGAARPVELPVGIEVGQLGSA